MFPIPMRSRTRLQAGGQRRIPPYCQQADGISQASQSPCAEISGFRLSELVRGRLFHVHGAHLRFVAGARQRQSEKDLLYRSFARQIRFVRHPGQRRLSARKSRIHSASSRHLQDFLLQIRAGREADFLALLSDGARMLVQVCESLAAPQTMRRETAALCDAMAELGLQTSLIVTRDVAPGTENRIAVDSGVIEVVAAWRFLLDRAGSSSIIPYDASGVGRQGGWP